MNMEIDAPQIVALRDKVRAATEEFDMTVAFHEAWKPAAYDEDLHARIGRSYAANTFLTIRQALRREMLLGLMRLWDNDGRTPSLPKIANALKDGRIIDALATECEAHWVGLGVDDGAGVPEDEDPGAARRSEAAFGKEMSAALRRNAQEAVALVGRYDEDGPARDTLLHLRHLRDKELAHRQVRESVSPTAASTTDKEIEAFYVDMSRAIHLLRLAVEDTDYRPEETAELRRRHAALFWAGVRGERTEGHPDYKPPRRRPDPASE
jgi:hypothetical protein